MNAPEQLAQRAHAATPAQQRARYFSDDNGFMFRWPDVPARQFLGERDRAFDAGAPTGLIALDCSDVLQTAYCATTPVLLLRYANIRAGETLCTQFVASGEICYVIHGSGSSSNAGETIAWKQGDMFLFPGGGESVHRAGARDSLLYIGTDEPLLACAGLRAPEDGNAKIEVTHWPSEEIERRLAIEWEKPLTGNSTGRFVQFSSRALAPSNNTLPFVSVGLNTIAPGADQRAHRHNGVAVTLVLEGAGAHSMIDGQRIDWSLGAVQITPPTTLHSHHNPGVERGRMLIFQDEALHYYTRTPGFSFE
jgi:gentisate 1,2-dioxygenase